MFIYAHNIFYSYFIVLLFCKRVNLSLQLSRFDNAQVQERKLLLKKIRSLKEQLGGGGGSQEMGRGEEEEGESSRRKRLVEEEEEEMRRRRGGEVREELGIQCDLGDSEAIMEAYSGSCSK